MSARFFANITVTFATRLVPGETIKIGFSHESVRKQEVFAWEKTHSHWWKKAPHQPITKWHVKTRHFVAGEQGEVVGGTNSDGDSEF